MTGVSASTMAYPSMFFGSFTNQTATSPNETGKNQAPHLQHVDGKTNSSPAKALEDSQCETCENRSYQDVSTDPGVSFQTPQHIDPNVAASVVRGHEMEHVVHSQVQARMEGKEVVSQSVVLHNAICPECGRSYVAGGVTKTSTRTKNEEAFEVGLPDNKESGQKLDKTA